MKGSSVSRRVHFWLGTAALLFLGVSAITGLMWAYAPYLYWQPGYMEKKRPEPGLQEKDLEGALPPQAFAASIGDRFGAGSRLTAVALQKEAGVLLYKVHALGPDGTERRGLIDARTGTWISPLSRERAIQFARQYVGTHLDVEGATLLEDWRHRKGTEDVRAWRITFADEGRTQIFLSPETGEILEDQDSVRRFHWWVMRLHQFNFFGTKKILTIVSGLPLLLLIATAIPLIRRRLSRRRSRPPT